MKKFIELSTSEGAISINAEHITAFARSAKTVVIHTVAKSFVVLTPYERFIELLASALAEA